MHADLLQEYRIQSFKTRTRRSQESGWFEAACGRFHRLALPRREAGMVLELGHLALLRSKALAAKQYVVEAFCLTALFLIFGVF